MKRLLLPLCYTILLYAGNAAGLELQVAIVNMTPQQTAPQTLQPPVENSVATSGRATLLTDFNLALAREICRRISAKCVFSYPAFSEIIPGIESKRFQLGFGHFLRTPEREAHVAFSDTLWRSSSRLLARPEVASRFAVALGGEVNLKNLRNARVVAITDSQQYRYLQNIASTQGLKVLGLATMGDCFAALNKAQADFGLLPVLNAYVIMEQTAEKNLSFIGPGMMGDGLGGTVHIALPREDETLRKKVDGALTEIHRDGSYQRIWRQYFPFDFY